MKLRVSWLCEAAVESKRSEWSQKDVRCDFILFGLCQTWFVHKPDLWLPGALVAKRRRAAGHAMGQTVFWNIPLPPRCDCWRLCYPVEHTSPAKLGHSCKKFTSTIWKTRTKCLCSGQWCADKVALYHHRNHVLWNALNPCSTSSAFRLECTKI